MAKLLNITAEQIQSTTNMLTTADGAAAVAANWQTDGKYPSAKAVDTLVADKIAKIIPSDKFEHPIGSIIIMGPDPTNPYSANDPSSKLGGKWALIDKAFKTATSELGGDPSTPYSVAATGLSIAKEVVIRNDHSLLLQLELQVSSSSAIELQSGQTSKQLATLTVNNYGLTGSSLSLPIINATAFSTSPSTTASSIIRYSITTDRKLLLNDIVTGGVATRKLEAGSSIYINVTIPITYTDMKNDFCDKFYWQRTE